MVNPGHLSAASVLAAGLLGSYGLAESCGPRPIYQNASYSPTERAQDLLPRLTWQEKIGQLGGVRRLLGPGLSFNQTAYDVLAKTQNGILGYGSQLNPGVGVLPLANRARQQQMNTSRVPFITVTDSVNGPYVQGGSLFPASLSVAATFNVPLYADVVAAIRDENLALGTRWVLSPELDVPKDPRYGRVGETYGEDPFLVGEFATQYVKTMQELDEDGYVKVACTIKHYIYGTPDGGINTASQLGGLNHIFNDQLPPYIKVIREAQPASLMVSYATVDRVPMSINKYLLQDILRQKLGFEGVIMSDAGAIANLYTQSAVATSRADAALKALQAGLQLELSPGQPASFPNLVDYANSTVVAQLVDQAVLQLLQLKFKAGLFDQPLPTVEKLEATFRAPAHLEVNRNVSREAVVLLQNTNDTLPLQGTKKVALLGPFANIINAGTYAANNSTNRSYGTSLLQSLQSEFGVSNVLFEPGVDFLDTSDSSDIAPAVAIAREAGLAVISLGSLAVQGEDPLAAKRTDGEFYTHADLGFPGLQQQLLDAVLDAGVPTVLVINGGQAFVINNQTLARAGAVLHAFLGGEFSADAVAEILVGKVNPSGKLPISLPQHTAAIPIAYDYLPSDATAQWSFPQLTRAVPFAFGFGLSYTTFQYSVPAVEVVTSAPGSTVVNVSVSIKNAGGVSGKEAVQLYYRKPYSLIETSVKQLIGVNKVSLAAGATELVSFSIKANDLGYYLDGDWKHEAGNYTFYIGSSSRLQDLQAVNIQL
ncbi:beta-glucosidase [Thozetella sp. PMI_491]|nr:beta-glucosidase [Thozetella sp. PMI_491]